jgi:hypothetical protein
VSAERPGRGVKSDEAGGRVIWEDFHNKRWMDGWTDGRMEFFFFGRKQKELWDPLFSRCTYIAAGWMGLLLLGGRV